MTDIGHGVYSIDMTLATVTRSERGFAGPPGRSCFIEFPDPTTAKVAIADLLLAGLSFTVCGFFLMPGGTAEIFFALDIAHDLYLTPMGDAMEEAFRSYAKSLGGEYTGS